MARKRRHRRRRSRGRFAILYRLLTFVVICGAIIAALALFFKVDSIEVTGNKVYDAEEIVESSGITAGQNLFFMNKYEVASRITTKLPYVQAVTISRRLPDVLSIHVDESRSVAAVQQDNKFWIISSSGKLVDCKDNGKKAKYTMITGVELTDPEIGKTIKTDEEHQMALSCLLPLLEQLSDKDMLGATQAIDLSDPSIITLRYLNRFEVQIPVDADLDYKLNYLLAVVEKLEGNEKGKIDLTQEGKASFIPT